MLISQKDSDPFKANMAPTAACCFVWNNPTTFMGEQIGWMVSSTVYHHVTHYFLCSLAQYYNYESQEHSEIIPPCFLGGMPHMSG